MYTFTHSFNMCGSGVADSSSRRYWICMESTKIFNEFNGLLIFLIIRKYNSMLFQCVETVQKPVFVYKIQMQ